MSRYLIDPDRTTFGITTRPGMPGLGVRVSGATGHVQACIDDDGKVDLTEPVSGAFELTVEDLHTDNRLLTAAVKQLFAGGTTALVTGEILEARARADRRLDLVMVIELRGRRASVVGAGSVQRRPNGDLEATGSTMSDPRAFGLPLPPLVNLMVHVRWRIGLTDA